MDDEGITPHEIFYGSRPRLPLLHFLQPVTVYRDTRRRIPGLGCIIFCISGTITGDTAIGSRMRRRGGLFTRATSPGITREHHGSLRSGLRQPNHRKISPIFSTCPCIPMMGMGKSGTYYLVHGDLPRQHSFRTTFEVYWPCAGGLSAVNTIGTQLRDPINSGQIRWRMAVLNLYMNAAAELGRNPVSKHQVQIEYGDKQAYAEWNCRTRLARPNSQARTRTGKYSFFLFS